MPVKYGVELYTYRRRRRRFRCCHAGSTGPGGDSSGAAEFPSPSAPGEPDAGVPTRVTPAGRNRPPSRAYRLLGGLFLPELRPAPLLRISDPLTRSRTQPFLAGLLGSTSRRRRGDGSGDGSGGRLLGPAGSTPAEQSLNHRDLFFKTRTLHLQAFERGIENRWVGQSYLRHYLECKLAHALASNAICLKICEALNNSRPRSPARARGDERRAQAGRSPADTGGAVNPPASGSSTLPNGCHRLGIREQS